MRDDALHEQRVDVAAREHRDGRAGRSPAPVEDRGDRDRAGRLDHELGALQQHEQGPGDVVVATP